MNKIRDGRNGKCMALRFENHRCKRQKCKKR